MTQIRVLLCVLAVAVLLASGFASAENRPGDSDTAYVACVAMHSKMGDPVANLDRIEHWLRRAHAAGASFVVFPEECITGSLNKSNTEHSRIIEIVDQSAKLAVPRLEKLCRELKLTVVAGTITPGKEKCRNSALVVGPRGHLFTYDKLCLPNASEEKLFRPGNRIPIISSQGWKISVGICADLDHRVYVQAAAKEGAELYLMPIAGSGSVDDAARKGDHTGQAKLHKSLHAPIMRDHAARFGIYMFYANQFGKSGNALFPGLALAVDPSGKLVDEHLPDEGMTVTKVSKQALARVAHTRKINTRVLSRKVLNSSRGEVSILTVPDPAKKKEGQ